MVDRQISTTPEDFWNLLKVLFSENYKFLHVIDKFSMLEGPDWLIFYLTSCMSEMMAFLKASDTQWFRKMQAYSLTYSI